MSTHLKVAIAEPADIIRYGLEMMLKRLPGFRLQLVEIASAGSLLDLLQLHKPDLLIINPLLPGHFGLSHIKEDCGCQEMKCVALLTTPVDPQTLEVYDERLSLYDSAEEIACKLQQLANPPEAVVGDGEEGQQLLSQREKEIVVCVVKGMTNREIADQLYLSTHTVVTHRRNIARKLQIHSASGLTIYAIVNKLVELSDIKQ